MDTADIFIMALAFLGGALPVCAIAFWRHHVRRVSDLERQLDDPETPDRRLAALEQAVDALIQQVDQLASGQEFLTRLVANQQRQELPRLEPPQADTPH